MPFRFRLPGALRLVLLLLGWLLLAGPARATHIVGGEMELVHNTGDSYTLVLNLYFDAVYGSASALDADLTASIFEKGSNSRMANVVLPLTSNTFVNYTNPACAQPSLSTRRLVYSKNITLSANTYTNAAGYYVAVERCCRNNSISNIVAPGNAAQTFYLEFPAVVRRGSPFYDSTPRIFPPLADYACINELFYYDFGGRDADGDSLVYDLVTPLNGHADTNTPKPASAQPAPYSDISWNPGLSTTNQIPGAPTLRIDRRTGRLTVRPTNQGLFVFGVRCAEYRRGEKIGECRRDFQLMALACPTNTKPRIVLQPTATGAGIYRPGRDTLRFVPGGNRCVRLRFTDPDPNTRLTLTLSPVNFTGLLPNFTTSTTGAVRSPGAPDTLTATLCFPECLNSRGRVFLLDVVVGDDGCSLPKRDTVRVAFTAVPPPNSPPQLVTTAGPTLPLHARVGDLVSFDVTGTDPDNDPIQLEMTGQGFNPASLGATLSQGTQANQQRGRFTWRVDCRAVGADSVFNFQFAAATSPCSERQAATVSVPIVVRYANRPPTLTSDLPAPKNGADLPEVVLPLGQTYTATFNGVDPDRDGLTLMATGTASDGKEGFDLGSAGMRFVAQNGSGVATGTFRWDVSCAAANLHRDLVVAFQLIDATCRPLPQVQRVRLRVKSPDTVAVKLYNVITPNRDGQNDEFRLPELPPNFCDSQFTNIRIFSRWGQQVFESTDRDFHWPGTGSGGMFYYFITYTDGRRFKGWLEVIP
ncbi:T9SS type B sorting domain-containing protein [Hymenobacter properus]|uniref:Gliding motility-associated C-terminal domain-containing protein n=1 Tax=Hymenobacter properus TaxID=2791026 RepID=A0A931FH30_9BACT|nr:gliding motility-associated C-terminal domain-containing protein [Hymenobacter properus]MBF9140622.1 gliding motility-associated C-terminal domain-containing protein [Hymenobacter properus]MBR7719430.1 gliding motility-associated C-terminal domain-containing protein [Microvirga sp. SRT04]